MKDFVWQEGSQTIRTVPENYLVASRENGKRFNIGEMDLAIDITQAIEIFKHFRKFEIIYGKPELVVDILNNTP